MSKRGDRRGWVRHELDLAKAHSLFRRAGFGGSEVEPATAYAHRDRQGRWRRVHARWPDGWRATLTLYVDGSQALSMALRVVTRPSGAEA